MTVRKEDRGAEPRWVIDIPYRTVDGRKARYRRDAQVQTKTSAEAEHRRLLVELARSGSLEGTGRAEEQPAVVQQQQTSFAEAVRYYRATDMQTRLKPSTRASYDRWLDSLLLPRFGDRSLIDVSGRALAELDAELVADELKPSTRANIHCVFRSVLRCAVNAGHLPALPRFPPLPKVGRQIVRPMRTEHVERLLAACSPSARLALSLMAFAGLRPSEVRGLRWCDVDLKSGVLGIRRGVIVGEETTPKSHHHRAVPLSAPLRAILDRLAKQKHSPWAEVALTAHGKRWGDFGLHQACQRAQKRGGLSGWSPKSLRHHFATELFARGASAPVIQKLLGHSDLATTQRYADVDADDLRGAIALLDGNSVETVKSRPR
jgi:integrase